MGYVETYVNQADVPLPLGSRTVPGIGYHSHFSQLQLPSNQVKVKVMLRPTVQSASLSWNNTTRSLLLSDSCRLVDVGRSL
jgi:hypothetical protein